MAPGRRSGRAAAQKAAAALESTPKTFEGLEDEQMPDVSAKVDDDQGSEHEPQPDDDDEDGENDLGEEDEEKKDDDDGDEEHVEEEKEPTPPPVPMVRRKRLGRPPKNKPPDWDPMISVPADEANTPRRRGRGGWRGRGGRKGGPAAPKAEQVIDAEGTVAEIQNDECVLPEDPEGEEKVDKLGNLSGGRDYRCRVFTVMGRGERLYMLSTEPARCVGFRDSYLFFTKHRKLHKIIVDDDEKRDMIERDIIPHSYKGRSIGVVTARSVFREFGARIIVGGKRIIDDYAVSQVRADGVVEGELADPDDRIVPGEPYNKNQYVAWHGASAVYHTNQPSVPAASGKPESKKRRVNVNDMNWMLEHAREASTFNASINSLRKLNNTGVYDVHTNTVHYPIAMQPTRARWEQVPSTENQQKQSSDSTSKPRFPPVPLRMARNFYIADTYMELPPSGMPNSTVTSYQRDAGPPDFLAAFNGLSAVSEDIANLLPPECRTAFDKAVGHEKEWKSRWGTETECSSRREPIVDKAIVPYSLL